MLDVNILVALLTENHLHHQLVTSWFNVAGMQWSMCPFTEAGLLRNLTAPRPGQITMAEATLALNQLAQHTGYHFLPIDAGWQTLCGPLLPRLYGTKQVTDAYLLGLSLRNGLILVTLDKALFHLAGSEHAKCVLVLRSE